MSTIKDDSEPWSEHNKDNRGLPRPYYELLPKELEHLKKHRNVIVSKVVPIPWQSRPWFGLIVENESKVESDNLCGYCGVKFSPEDPAVRWTTKKGIYGDRVRSDHLPFHEECMNQARLFCPHMRNTVNEEFEHGPYARLRNNAEADIHLIKKREQ